MAIHRGISCILMSVISVKNSHIQIGCYIYLTSTSQKMRLRHTDLSDNEISTFATRQSIRSNLGIHSLPEIAISQGRFSTWVQPWVFVECYFYLISFSFQKLGKEFWNLCRSQKFMFTYFTRVATVLIVSLNLFWDFYRPQTKFAKVVFLHVSVCARGVCPIACWDISPLGRQTPTPMGRTPWADTPPAHTHPLGRHTPSCAVHAGIRSTSRRYASHWNAILFGCNNGFQTEYGICKSQLCYYEK